MKNTLFPIRLFRASLICCGVVFALSLHASAQTATLSKLVTLDDTNGATGSMPLGTLLQGNDGNFYGTTVIGGTGGHGTIFKMSPAGGFSTLVNFAPPDGNTPRAGLIQAADGNFYGTTQLGGPANAGTVYRLTPAGSLTTLVNFAGSNGAEPYCRLVQAADGNLYGTTFSGGTGGDGTVFRMSTDGALQTLVNFSGSNGSHLLAGLIQASDGNFYGMTYNGGGDPTDVGALFRVQPNGTLTTLVSFNRTNGMGPDTELIQGSDGNLYGTTTGTADTGGPLTQGTIFQCTLTGVLTTIASRNGGNGAQPYYSLIDTGDGSLYGVSSNGGQYNNGTVFKVVGGTFMPLVSFGAASGVSAPNGQYPVGGLIQGSDGSFFGTTANGGVVSSDSGFGCGTVFKVAVSGVTPPPRGLYPGTLQFGSATVAVNENAGNAVVMVTRTNGGKGAVSVHYATADGTAAAGMDYSAAAGTLTWADDEVGGKPITVPITDRFLMGGGTKTFSIALDSAGGGATLGAVVSTSVTISDNDLVSPFFNGQAALGNGVYYLSFPNGNYFGYYGYLTDPHYVYHFDMGYEYVFDASDGKSGVYLYDFKSNGFFYTSPAFPFPYLYDFTLNTVLYYFPDPNNTGHYNTNGYRFFYRFDNGQIIVK